MLAWSCHRPRHALGVHAHRRRFTSDVSMPSRAALTTTLPAAAANAGSPRSGSVSPNPKFRLKCAASHAANQTDKSNRSGATGRATGPVEMDSVMGESLEGGLGGPNESISPGPQVVVRLALWVKANPAKFSNSTRHCFRRAERQGLRAVAAGHQALNQSLKPWLSRTTPSSQTAPSVAANAARLQPVLTWLGSE